MMSSSVIDRCTDSLSKVYGVHQRDRKQIMYIATDMVDVIPFVCTERNDFPSYNRLSRYLKQRKYIVTLIFAFPWDILPTLCVFTRAISYPIRVNWFSTVAKISSLISPKWGLGDQHSVPPFRRQGLKQTPITCLTATAFSRPFMK